jgi:hypothetical protein
MTHVFMVFFSYLLQLCIAFTLAFFISFARKHPVGRVLLASLGREIPFPFDLLNKHPIYRSLNEHGEESSI